MSETPAWKELISEDPHWVWREGRLFHIEVPEKVQPPSRVSALHRAILQFCYANHNTSKKIKRTLGDLCGSLGPEEWGLNVGSGETVLHPRVLNLDITCGPSVQVVARGQKLPFKDDSLDLVISQEVLEHLPDPRETVAEVLRVLKVGGRFYCQIPFIIGYHPGPTDFWRFTREGIAQLFSAGHWRILQLDTSAGHGTGAYRIAVECCAVTGSVLHSRLYLPCKGFFAIALMPIKLLDLVSDFSPQKHRIPGGYFCVVTKVGTGRNGA